MGPHSPADPRAAIRRALSWALVVALCVASLTAMGAILSGDFDETDGRVILTSLGFAVFSATAASGASLRLRASAGLRALGAATAALSVLSFLLLLLGLWRLVDDDAWRWFGSAALAALACSHTSLVVGTARETDGVAVQVLARASIALAAVDAFAGILAVTGAVDEVDGSAGQLIAALVILLMLTTALPPVLRRVQRPAPGRGAPLPAEHSLGPPPARSTPPPTLATAVLAAADRIEALNADPGNRAPDIRRECERLRALARSHAR